MKLEGEEKQKALNWLNQKLRSNLLCPACGAHQWQLLDRIFEVRAFDIGAPLIPFVVIACGNCGNMQFFNALHIGIMNRKPMPDKEVPEPVKGGAQIEQHRQETGS